MELMFNPELLLLARNYRQKSQFEVAQAANMHQGHYSRIENGLISGNPAQDSLNRIAKVLEFPIEFFYQDDKVSGLPMSIHPMYRRRQGIRERDLKKIQSELNIRLIHLRRYLRSVDLHPELPVPICDVDDDGGPQRIARSVRQAWSISNGPLLNLTERCERAGILVIHCDLPAPIDGVTMSARDLPHCVFLNTRVTADRMRFSLAHELGHIVMHRIPTDSIEDEANAFAAELLVPEREFRRSVVGHRITLQWLARQKAFWKASMAFLLYRSSALDLLNRHQSEYLWRKISALGWRTREPEETDFEVEAPALFPRIVKIHSQDLGYDVSALKRLLRSSTTDIWKLYGGIIASGADGRLQLVK